MIRAVSTAGIIHFSFAPGFDTNRAAANLFVGKFKWINWKTSSETQPFGSLNLRITSATSGQLVSAGNMASRGLRVAKHLLSRVGRWISGFAGKTSFITMPN